MELICFKIDLFIFWTKKKKISRELWGKENPEKHSQNFPGFSKSSFHRRRATPKAGNLTLREPKNRPSALAVSAWLANPLVPTKTCSPWLESIPITGTSSFSAREGWVGGGVAENTCHIRPIEEEPELGAAVPWRKSEQMVTSCMM